MKMKKEKTLEIRITNLSTETINHFEEIRTNKYSGDKKKTFEGLLDIYQYFNLKSGYFSVRPQFF